MPRTAANPPEPTGLPALDQSELRKHPGYFLARARFVALRTYEEHIGAVHQLRPIEFALLVLVGSNSDVTQKRLSQALGVAQPNMTGILRRLEERGLLERTRSEQDKRMQFIALTGAGTKLVKQAMAAGRGMDKGWLRRLSDAEQAMLVELLEKVSLGVPEAG